MPLYGSVLQHRRPLFVGGPRRQPENKGTFLGTPSLLPLNNGTLLASHDYFGWGQVLLLQHEQGIEPICCGAADYLHLTVQQDSGYCVLLSRRLVGVSKHQRAHGPPHAS